MDNTTYFALIVIVPIVLYVVLQFAKRNRSDVVQNRKNWQRVKSIASGSEPQFAIIEADKVFDQALKQRGFRGETMGDRLRSAKPSLKNNNAVWSAHKLRNRLVHETEVKVSKKEVSTALASFEKGLRSLGAL
ncbi:hypothetical protein KBB17_04295 [Candidatus Saccharibacteria bacterium]|nr:hypothetical protein [Candidatus Saccharibacteria bacterium]MBP9131938.1 hypothetical protein [Candidatus Saccharibacteria bacterium]